MTDSKVSTFLRETLAPEIQEGLMGPLLFRSFPILLPLITEINKAHVLMLARCNIITQPVAAALLQCAVTLEAEGPAAFTLDPAREDSYFNYEAEVIRRLGPDVGGRMHIARSRNDLKATLDRMRARARGLEIMDTLLAVRARLIERADRFSDCVMPGYTHMQPAQPITFGYYLAGIAQGLERDFRRVAECHARLNLCPMGAGALAGTSFPIDREMTAALLGFDGPVAHAQDAVAARDAVIELVSACAFLMTTIGRMAQDFYTMTTYEFSTLELPDRVAITSSIMPQKKNMAALENLKGRPAILAGALMTALAGYKGTPYSHVQDGNTDALRWIWDALEEVVLALPVARLVIETAEPKRERMLELARANYSTATDLADVLVRDAGLSFRDAHHVVGRVVRLAMADGCSADGITRELVAEAARQTLGHAVELPAEVVRDAVDPIHALQSRRNTGGPSRHDIARILAGSTARLEADRTEFAARRAQIAAARQRLDNEVAIFPGGSPA